MLAVKGLQQIRYLNSISASITRPHRNTCTRLYPTVLVLPDGSTFKIRYSEPRKIITLPLNIWTLSESERKIRQGQRKPKKKVVIVDDLEDTFDSTKYLKYIKK